MFDVFFLLVCCSAVHLFPTVVPRGKFDTNANCTTKFENATRIGSVHEMARNRIPDSYCSLSLQYQKDVITSSFVSPEIVLLAHHRQKGAEGMLSD